MEQIILDWAPMTRNTIQRTWKELAKRTTAPEAAETPRGHILDDGWIQNNKNLPGSTKTCEGLD